MTAAGYQTHQTTVAKLESGNRPTDVGEIAALAAIFSLPIGSVFDADDEDEQMLLKLSEADSEVVRLTQELLDHVKAEQDIQARLHAAKQHRKVLQGIAFKKPGVMRRLAYADYLLEPGDKTRDQLQQAIDKERPGDGEH